MSCHFVAQRNYSRSLSHTLTMSPRKLMWECITQKGIAMHIAFRLKKKKTHIKQWWTQSIYLAKKKEKKKKQEKNSGRNMNKYALQANKNKSEIELVRFESCIQKKNRWWANPFWPNANWTKRDPHHRIQELCKHLDCHWLHGGIESLQSIPLARGASFIILFSHQ